MVVLASTAMSADNSSGKFEGDIGLRDKATDMEKPSETEGNSDVVAGGTTHKRHRGRFGCRCRDGKEPNVKDALKFIDTVQEGIHIDVKQGRRSGERTPREFWARVWNDIHRSGGGPPENLPNKTLREKWRGMEKSGSSAEAIWEHMEREYPGPFLVVPLVYRWHHMGKGKPVETVNAFGGLNVYNDIVFKMDDTTDTAELKEQLEEMKRGGKEEEFWREHWDDVHGSKRMRAICDNKKSTWRGRDTKDWETWMYPRRQTDSSGREVTVIPGYQQCYPLGYSLYNRLRKPADERPIYKEFDFCS